MTRFHIVLSPFPDEQPCGTLVSAREGTSLTLITQGRGQNYERGRWQYSGSDNAVLADHMGPNDMSRVVVVGDHCVSYQPGGHSTLGLKGRHLRYHVTYSEHFQVVELRFYFIFFWTSLHSFSCSFHSKIQSQDRIMILHQLLCQVGKF